MVEHSNTFKNKYGTEVEIRVKTKCSSNNEMREALRFTAQSSHKFYLELAEKISNTL